MDDDTRCEIETSRKCFLNEKNKMQMHKFQKRGENDNNNIDDDKKKKKLCSRENANTKWTKITSRHFRSSTTIHIQSNDWNLLQPQHENDIKETYFN